MIPSTPTIATSSSLTVDSFLIVYCVSETCDGPVCLWWIRGCPPCDRSDPVGELTPTDMTLCGANGSDIRVKIVKL